MKKNVNRKMQKMQNGGILKGAKGAMKFFNDQNESRFNDQRNHQSKWNSLFNNIGNFFRGGPKPGDGRDSRLGRPMDRFVPNDLNNIDNLKKGNEGTFSKGGQTVAQWRKKRGH